MVPREPNPLGGWRSWPEVVRSPSPPTCHFSGGVCSPLYLLYISFSLSDAWLGLKVIGGVVHPPQFLTGSPSPRTCHFPGGVWRETLLLSFWRFEPPRLSRRLGYVSMA